MNTTREQIENKLLNEYSYKQEQIDGICAKLFSMSDELQAAFELWFDDGLFGDKPSYSGLTPSLLWDLGEFKPPAVFLLLDWVQREPVDAIRAFLEDFGQSLSKEKYEKINKFLKDASS